MPFLPRLTRRRPSALLLISAELASLRIPFFPHAPPTTGTTGEAQGTKK